MLDNLPRVSNVRTLNCSDLVFDNYENPSNMKSTHSFHPKF